MSKFELFRFDMYICPVPPVCTAAWGTDDWIKWIDTKGKWQDN